MTRQRLEEIYRHRYEPALTPNAIAELVEAIPREERAFYWCVALAVFFNLTLAVLITLPHV
jgi:hypothetical protein